MHVRQISHGDLKPENLVFESRFVPGRIPFIRLIDFGFAVDRNDVLYKKYGMKSTEFGTPLYMAPEKLRNQELNEKSDIWAVGVMVYYMLCGYPPFYSDKEPDLFKQIKTNDYGFYEEWDPKKGGELSADAKNFVEGCLEPDLDTRFSAKQCLSHPWI